MADVHVLIAEDEVLAAMALEEFLSCLGYRVTLAADGAEALKRYDEAPADLVITDLRMPRLDGRGLIRALRDRSQRLPVIVMTGYLSMEPGDDDLTEARWKPLEILRKPVSPQAILDTMRGLLAQTAP